MTPRCQRLAFIALLLVVGVAMAGCDTEDDVTVEIVFPGVSDHDASDGFQCNDNNKPGLELVDYSGDLPDDVKAAFERSIRKLVSSAELSVQLKSICEYEAAVAERFEGAAGGGGQVKVWAAEIFV